MIFTEEKITDFAFPNITVHTRLRDGEPCAYIATADEGFLIYDAQAEEYEQTSPDSEPTRVIHYHSKVICPLGFDFSHFPWVAVRADDIPERYIF